MTWPHSGLNTSYNKRAYWCS